jgi:type 1 fimbria pilin
MLSSWRRVTAAVLAGAAAIAAQLAAITTAHAAAPTITINATAKTAPVTHDVVVYYKDGAFAIATIHGKITGAAPGDTAALYAWQWPYKKPAVRLGAVTLKSSAPVYSFTVTPVLATRYVVRLFAAGTSKAPLAASAAQYVYVASGGRVTGGSACARPVCTQTLHLFTILPSSALSTEIGKHLYTYFGLNLSTTGEPPPPKWLNLNAGQPSVTKARKINAGEFETTVTFTFTIGNDGWFWLWDACARDTLGKDGMGLPGHHGCGTLSRVSGSAFTYLG